MINKELLLGQILAEGQRVPYGFEYGDGLVSDCFGLMTKALRNLVFNESTHLGLGYIYLAQAFIPHFNYDGMPIRLMAWNGSAWVNPMGVEYIIPSSRVSALPIYAENAWFTLYGDLVYDSEDEVWELRYNHMAFFDAWKQLVIDRINLPYARVSRVADIESTSFLQTGDRVGLGMFIPLDVLRGYASMENPSPTENIWF
jgi:hypothetical protein